jgi:CHAT domain-containing protein
VAAAALRQPRRLTTSILVFLLLPLSACRKPVSPDERYAHIRDEVQHGDLDSGLADADRAYREYAGRDIGRAWQFRVLKAYVLYTRGSAWDAIQLLQEEPPASLSTSETAIRRKIISGLARESLQQFDQAERELTEAEALAGKYQPSLLGSIEQSKGLLETDQRKYAEADRDFYAALYVARAQKMPFLEATALGALGNSAMSQEHFDAAIDRYKSALALAQSLGSQSSVAKALGGLGWSSYELGDFETAQTFFQQGADASQRSGLVADQIYWLTEVANTQVALRNYAAADDNLTKVIGLARKQDDKRILSECLNDLTSLELKIGRLDLAERHNQESRNLEAAGLDQSATRSNKLLTARIFAGHRQFDDAERLYQQLIEDPQFARELKAEAQVGLADVYADQKLPKKAESQFVGALQTLETVRTSVQQEESRLSFLSSGISFYADYIDFLISQGRNDDALRVAELSRARTLEEGLGKSSEAERLSNVQPKQIAGRLRATLLFYWLGEKQSHLWVITPANTTHVALPAADQIDPLVKSYREALFRSRDPLETDNADAQKLYAMLVEPAKKLIPKDSRVILLPDGSLYALNFETLIVPEPKLHYWIEDVTLTTANSLSLLASATARVAPKDKTLFLAGNTVSPNPDFPPLPQAVQEMEDVEKYFPQARRVVLTGAHGTPAAYLSSQPERFSYMHFVTHGTASRARPLESAVILSKDKDADSFKLYARDIVKRRLSAYLVVISACNGAGTRAYSGEGLVGLSWAFLRAGAHNVIGALWEVSDSSTPQLMDKLYDGLSHGQDPATALRAAKLSLLRSGTVYKKPFYWAPFQLYAGS